MIPMGRVSGAIAATGSQSKVGIFERGDIVVRALGAYLVGGARPGDPRTGSFGIEEIIRRLPSPAHFDVRWLEPEEHSNVDQLVLRRQHFGRDDLARFPSLGRIVVFGRKSWIVDPRVADRVEVLISPRPSLQRTAEHALTLMELAFRRAAELVVGPSDLTRGGSAPPVGNPELQKGSYNWADRFTPRFLSDSRVGLVGLGDVGLELATLLRGRVDGLAYWSRSRVPREVETAVGIEHFESLHEMLAVSDIVSIHVGPTRAPVIDRQALAHLRHDAVVINTARAGSWDEVAVLEAVRDHRVAAAATDVLSSEPPASELSEFTKHVIVTPHLAGGPPARVGEEFRQVAARLAGLDPA